jgi:hypothetical protein
MHLRLSQVVERALVATSLLVVTPGWVTARADDEGFLSRLFRGGSSSSSSASSSASRPAGGGVPSGGPSSNAAGAGQPALPYAPMTGSNFGGLTTQTPVTTPPSGPSSPGQRLSPRPRTSTAVTNADPLLTRLALGRSDDGTQFGMFLQIFTDGTVIDSEGVHHLRPADLKPIVDLVQSGDLTRTHGHCGAPATDFVEYVNIVVYERRLGRLWAHSLSYSGNTQGCDHAVRHLHTTLEGLQMKLSRNTGGAQMPAGTQGTPRPLAPVGGAGSPAPLDHQPPPPAVNPGQPASGGVIPLTPVDSSR